jgi:hypothetical protein
MVTAPCTPFAVNLKHDMIVRRKAEGSIKMQINSISEK